MENNFNLKKFLTENKLTTNSRNLQEQLGIKATQEYLDADSNGVSIAEFVKAIIDGAAEFNQDEAMYYDLDPASQAILKAIGREDLTEKKLTTNSRMLREDFALSANKHLGIEDANYPVAKAFMKAGIDMSKPIVVVDSREDKPYQEDAKYFADHLDRQRRAFLSEYEEGGDFPVFYEFENNTVLSNDKPEGVEYKLAVAFFEAEDYSILQ